MAKSTSKLEGTKRLMGALVRMKPKPHEEMKIGKARVKRPAKAKKKHSVARKP
jgi:hypothetical protein